jgi:hypothetical protein
MDKRTNGGGDRTRRGDQAIVWTLRCAGVAAFMCGEWALLVLDMPEALLGMVPSIGGAVLLVAGEFWHGR